MFDDDNMYSSYSQYHDDDINSHIHHDYTNKNKNNKSSYIK